jgi:hypothetical protein
MNKIPDMPTADDYGPPDESSMVQGKWVILGIVGISVAASAISWIYYARLQERPLALWGSQAAELILRAPDARAYRVMPLPIEGAASPEASPRSALMIDGQSFVSIDERDVSHANGFSHIRNSLIHDRSFAWDEPPCDVPPTRSYVIEFTDGKDRVALALAFDCPRATILDTDRVISIRPVAKAIEDFLGEQFPQNDNAAPAK